MAQKGAVWPVVGWQDDIDPVDSTVLPVEVTLANWTRTHGSPCPLLPGRLHVRVFFMPGRREKRCGWNPNGMPLQ